MAPTKPHVIFALTDDWGWELWPHDASRAALLPVIRELFFDGGMTLSRHFAFMFCAPSRQSLLTGRLPHHVNQANSVCMGAPLAMRTIANRMRAAGAHTTLLGKWHCGFISPGALPGARGFDDGVAFLMKAHHHYLHCSVADATDRHAQGECRTSHNVSLFDAFTFSPGRAPFRSSAREAGPAHPAARDRIYSTALYRDEALRRIAAHDAAPDGPPLFLLLSFSAPHRPLLAPPWLEERARRARPDEQRACARDWYVSAAAGGGAAAHDRCTERTRASRLTYEAMVAGVDEAIGAVAEALKSRGMWERSLLVFASDNGAPMLPYSSNLPLRRGKGDVFDGGVRTRAALGGGWLPRHMRGATSDVVVHISDWYATLSGLMGVPAADPNEDLTAVPPLDSVDVWSALTSSPLPRRRHAEPQLASLGPARTLVLATPEQSNAFQGALLDARPAGPCGAGETGGGRGGGGGGGGGSSSGACDSPRAYKLVLNGTGGCRPGPCLFETVADPAEAVDLAAARPALLTHLLGELRHATRGAWTDPDRRNAECWTACRDAHKHPDCWMDYAQRHGATMQPFAYLK